MIIVTSGSAYVDIDAFSGCIAYAELLRLLGQDAQAVLQAPLNNSIPETVKSWSPEFASNFIPQTDDVFVLVDISEARYFDKLVNTERVVEVIDHHLGFEDYWQERLGGKATIEFIGAAATLVYERWKAAGKQSQISRTSARLLVCGVLDNTLNFGAMITTDRDRQAYAELMATADLPADWPEKYFRECQQMIEADIVRALTSDTKHKTLPGLEGSVALGQLVVWDVAELLEAQQAAITATMQATSGLWAVNLISLKDGASYFIAEDKPLMSWLEGLLSINFQGRVAKADRMWLRKEITQASFNASNDIVVRFSGKIETQETN